MNEERMALLMRAKRAADEASEALRRMIEHDLAIHVPDSPDLQALREIASGRLEAAASYARSALPAVPVREVDSEAFVRHAADIAKALRGRVEFKS